MRRTWRPGGHRRADHLPLLVRVASLRQDAGELGGRRDDPTLAAVLVNEQRVVGVRCRYADGPPERAVDQNWSRAPNSASLLP